MNIFRFGLLPNEDHPFALPSYPLGLIGIKDRLSGGCPWRGWKACGHGFALKIGVEPPMEELFEFLGLQPRNGFFFGDQFLLDHLHRGADDGMGIHLSIPGLEDIEFSSFRGEFKILDLMEVPLQGLSDLFQLPVDLRHLLLHLLDRLRGSDPGHNILALGIDQIFSIENIFAGSRVSRERDTGHRIGSHVSEDHGADIDCCSVGHLRGDFELPAVVDSPLSHPGLENGFNGQLQLNHWILRERSIGYLFHEIKVLLADILECLHVEVRIINRSCLLFDPVQNLIKALFVDSQGDLSKKLDEPAVGIIGKPGISCIPNESLEGRVIQTQVEDRVHHSGHGEGCSGSN